MLIGGPACSGREVVAAKLSLPGGPAPLHDVGPASWRPGAWNVNDWGPISGQLLPLRADHVSAKDQVVNLVLDRNAGAQVQTTDGFGMGEAVAELTLPPLEPGQDAAFFLYSSSGDELDFEYLSRGLWLCVHRGGRQFGRFLDTQNHGGERVRLQVSWSEAQVMFAVNGAPVWTIMASELPTGMALPSTLMQAFFSNAAFKDNGFFGKFAAPGPQDVRTMVVRGFAFTPDNSSRTPLPRIAGVDANRGVDTSR